MKIIIIIIIIIISFYLPKRYELTARQQHRALPTVGTLSSFSVLIFS